MTNRCYICGEHVPRSSNLSEEDALDNLEEARTRQREFLAHRATSILLMAGGIGLCGLAPLALLLSGALLASCLIVGIPVALFGLGYFIYLHLDDSPTDRRQTVRDAERTYQKVIQTGDSGS